VASSSAKWYSTAVKTMKDSEFLDVRIMPALFRKVDQLTLFFSVCLLPPDVGGQHWCSRAPSN
jgi:hypothetical protein